MLGTAIFATLLVLVALVALGLLEERLGLVDFEAEVTHPQERELLTKFVKLNAKVGVHPSHG